MLDSLEVVITDNGYVDHKAEAIVPMQHKISQKGGHYRLA